MTFFVVRSEVKYLKNDMFKNKYITNLKLGSLFDGIGVLPLSASHHGITPTCASGREENTCIYYITALPSYALSGGYYKNGWW